MTDEPEDPPTATTLDASVTGARPALSPGDVLAGRYRIERFLARGGMGEVYEARDLDLGATVALKTIRSGLVKDDPQALARFKRELLLSRQVTHPNVARVFDLAHDTAGGRAVSFITMELLEGRTLADRLRADGPMTTAEALPVAEQIAHGLDAAHRAGIVHRDLKPSNVQLVPSAAGVRAVLTDFGLARPVASDAPEPAASGPVVGTPEYMAPEQVTGGEATSASDVYGLGLVLYEMVTGQRPFGTGRSSSPALARVREDPPSPRVFAKDLDPRWERVIVRCLQRDPGARFGSAEEAARALRGESARAAGSSRRVWVVAAAAAAALAVAGTVAWRARPKAPAAGPEATLVLPALPEKLRRSVAVLGFRNLEPGEGSDWLSTAFSEMLTTELGASGGVRAIAAESVARMKVDLGLADARALDRTALQRVRRHLGTDLVVLGSYRTRPDAQGARIELQVQVQDAESGATTAAFTESGATVELLDLVARAGTRLRAALGVPDPPRIARRALFASPQLARLYAEGLDHLRLFEAEEARGKLEQAAAIAPEEPLVHAALAGAWSELGHDAQARAEAQRAFELSSSLPEEERRWVEGRYRELAREWPRAVEVYRSLWARSPDEVEYGLRLANVLALGGRGREAATVVAALRRYPSPIREDPRIDLADALASLWTSDYKRQREAAQAAATKGRAMGARLVVARADLMDVWASTRLGDSEGVPRAAEEALSAYEAAGDRAGAAQVHNALGNWHWQEGRLDEARADYERALEVARRIGSVSGQGSAMNNLAVVLWDEGSDLPRARGLLTDALPFYTRVANRRGVAAVHDNTGLVLLDEGAVEAAFREFERALEVSREVGEKRGVAEALGNEARVRYVQGRGPEARRLFEESLPLYRETREARGTANVLLGLGRLLAESGERDRARSLLEEGVALAARAGQHGLAADALAALGDLRMEAGDAGAARQAWSDGVEHVRAQKRDDPAARVARAMLEARIAAPAEGARSLSAALDRARDLQRLTLTLEAGLLLGRLQLEAGETGLARARLVAVEEAARRAGFVSVAERAHRFAARSR